MCPSCRICDLESESEGDMDRQELEREIVAVLLHGETVGDATMSAHDLKPSEIQDSGLKTIYQAMYDLHRAGKSVAAFEVGELIGDHRKVDDLSTSGYSVPSAEIIERRIDKLRELNQRDRWASACRQAETMLAREAPLAEFQELFAGLDRYRPADRRLESLHLAGFLNAQTDTIARRIDGTEEPIPLPWPKVEKLMGGGLWPGLTVLVGNTGSGKTQLAIQAAHYAASNKDKDGKDKDRVPVLYIGLEIDRLGMVCRLLGLRSDAYWSDLYFGHLECPSRSAPGIDLIHNATEIINTHREALAELPFYFEPGSMLGWDPLELDRLCRKMRVKHPAGPFIVVLDFLQLVRGESDQLRENIGRAAYMGRAAAREHGASVILISSTARENYGTLAGTKGKGDVPLGGGNPSRFVGMGKESGEIEFACDWLLTLCAEETETMPRTVHLAAAKVRAGRPGWAKLSFDGTEFHEPKADKIVGFGGEP